MTRLLDSPPSLCGHPQFRVDAVVVRLTDRDGGPVTGYELTVSVRCETCGLDFLFPESLPWVVDGSTVGRNVDGTELRTGISPGSSRQKGMRVSSSLDEGLRISVLHQELP